MACPTCSHAMASVGSGIFHCGRCGTLIGCYSDGSAVVPKLVERCREFSAGWDENDPAAILWHRLGIAESINVPANRP